MSVTAWYDWVELVGSHVPHAVFLWWTWICVSLAGFLGSWPSGLPATFGLCLSWWAVVVFHGALGQFYYLILGLPFWILMRLRSGGLFARMVVGLGLVPPGRRRLGFLRRCVKLSRSGLFSYFALHRCGWERHPIQVLGLPLMSCGLWALRILPG